MNDIALTAVPAPAGAASLYGGAEWTDWLALLKRG